VICAAVSALAQAAALGLTERLGLDVPVQIRRGLLSMDGPAWDALDASRSSGAAVLLDTVVLAFEQLARQHPDYIRVKQGRTAGPQKPSAAQLQRSSHGKG
jgi:uncharacterized protein YsxB (DUF464 family)